LFKNQEPLLKIHSEAFEATQKVQAHGTLDLSPFPSLKKLPSKSKKKFESCYKKKGCSLFYPWKTAACVCMMFG